MSIVAKAVYPAAPPSSTEGVCNVKIGCLMRSGRISKVAWLLGVIGCDWELGGVCG